MTEASTTKGRNTPMPEDPAYAEIRALRERLAHLEKLGTSTERSNPVTIVHTDSGFKTSEERRIQSIAETFRRDSAQERLIGLEAAAEAGNLVASAEVSGLSPSARTAAGYYRSGRDAAIKVGLVNSNGDPK